MTTDRVVNSPQQFRQPFLWLVTCLGIVLAVHGILYWPPVRSVSSWSTTTFVGGSSNVAKVATESSHDNPGLPDLMFTLQAPLTDDDVYNEPNTLVVPSSSSSLCTRSQVIDGRWVPTVLPRPPYFMSTTQLRCHSVAYYKDPSGYATYAWKPHADCDLTSFRPTAACTLLERQTVMIMGDSLSWEHYRSLTELLAVPDIHQGWQHQSLELEQNIVQFACKNQTRLVYRRDDKLSNVSAALHATFPTILVLNRGAHYEADDILLAHLQNSVGPAVQAWQDECRRRYLPCQLYWRTTVPGHPHCDINQAAAPFSFAEPSHNKTVMEAWIANRGNYNDKTINYHWYNFQHQNELVEHFWQSHAYNVTMLDAYHINVLRPDDHRSHQHDCLHNCYPGKVDVYNTILIHYVRASLTLRQQAALRARHRFAVTPSTYQKELWMQLRRARNNYQPRGGRTNNDDDAAPG